MKKSSIKSDILKITIPSLMVALFDQLFAIIDTMLIGTISDKAIYTASLAAINVTTRIMLFIQALTNGTNIAATTIYSRYMGKNNKEQMQSTLVHTIFINVFVLTLPIIIISLLFTKQIMIFLGNNKIIFEVGKWYYVAILVGFIFCSFNNVFSYLLRACGDSKTALVCEVSSSIFNIVFDILLINGLWFFPKLGVTGAGIATGGSFMFLFILYFAQLFRAKSKLKLDFNVKTSFNKNMFTNILKIAIPTSVEALALKGASIFYTKIIAFLGVIALAAQQICITIYSLFTEIGDAIAIAITPLVSKALGQNDTVLAKKYVKYGVVLAIKIALVVALIFIIAKNQLLGLFTRVKEERKLLEVSLIFIVLGQFVQNIRDVFVAALRGSGDTLNNAIISFIFDILIKLTLSYIAVRGLNLGLASIWCIIFIIESVKVIIYYLRLKSGKMKTISLE